MNLVINARDAMPRGGKITVELSQVDLDQEFSNLHLGVTAGPYVMLAVSDTGCGMDKATLTRIFEPFFTTKETGKGTGLGLSTVFGIVQNSGGTVWVYSEPGLGSTFKMYLPLVSGELDRLVVRPAPAQLSGTETILLVEDEEQVRAVAADILVRGGYRVLVATDPAHAIELARSHPQHIDLLVSDVVMPVMSGPELARAIVAVRPTIKILHISGYTDDSIVRHGMVANDVPFLQKPLTPDALKRKVREVLDLP
jgi:CheY-like chemotaxis protein